MLEKKYDLDTRCGVGVQWLWDQGDVLRHALLASFVLLMGLTIISADSVQVNIPWFLSR